MPASVAIQANDVTMSFGPNEVLRGITLEIMAGEVTALLGANGAGKSTLIKILSGIYPGHGGTITSDGKVLALDSPLAARRLGIQTVHQHVDEAIVPGLSVAENLLFERIAQGTLPAVRSPRQLLPHAREVAASLQLSWDDGMLRRDVHELGIADRQLLILARALAERPRLLVLDEPTSALSQAESARLFEVVTRLREQGVGILYVSHRLGEIDSVADRLVILRDGRIRGDLRPPFDWRSALTEMLGRETVVDLEKLQERRGTESILRLERVRLLTRSPALDLTLRSGEVTGVIGLLGAGKSELAGGIFGASPFTHGRMTLNGAAYRPTRPSQAIARDVYLVPEDRASQAMLPGWSISRTASLPFLRELCSGAVIRGGRERLAGSALVDDFGVVAESAEQPVEALSGGNQQKVVVGRWLRGRPAVMLLDEPFRGVDIGARRDLSRRVRDVAAAGAVVLVLSADVDEILEVADRILVLVDGTIRLDSYTSEMTRERIVTAMAEVA